MALSLSNVSNGLSGEADMNDGDRAGNDDAAEEQEREFWRSVIECPHTERLVEVGNELVKVRHYANEHCINDELSVAMVALTLSAYDAGVTPLIRVEQSLNIARGLDNEYGYALAARAYIEVGGRVHKGTRLLKVFEKDTTKVEELHTGAARLLGRYAPEGKEARGLFKGKGFNVMSFVKALKDEVPKIEEIYDDLSAYVHGDYGEQWLARKISWLYQAKGEQSPIIKKYSAHLDELRDVIFSDLDLLLAVTSVIRQRYDEKHRENSE